MPGIINSLVNLISNYAIIKPHYFLVGMVLIIFFLMFYEQIFNIDPYKHITLITSIIIGLISIIILSTILHVLNVHDSGGYIDSLNNVFNSAGGRNFLAIFSLVLFVMYIYEFPETTNNNPENLLNKITFGHNNILSNKTASLITILFFTILTAYTVMETTNKVDK